MKKVNVKLIGAIGLLLFMIENVSAQIGKNLNNVTKATNTIGNDLKVLVGPLSNLLIIVGGIGAIGAAYSVYSKWQNGDEDAMKRLGRWMGAGIFILSVGIIVKALFLGQ